MNFTIERQGKIVIFKLHESKIDSQISPSLKAELLIICQPNIEGLIIDLQNVLSCDSSGLGCLLLAHRQLSEHSIPVILVNASHTVKTLLSISQIESLFEYYNSTQEALDSFN